MQYAVKRASIARHSDGKTLEMDLWHGTSPCATNGINYYGFNRSYCGKNGKYQYSFYGFFFWGGGVMHWSVWFSRKIQIQRTIYDIYQI